MTTTVLKTYLKWKDSIIINYRSYKQHLNEFEFRNDLLELLENFENKIMDYDDFNEIFLIVLDKYAPLKEKVLRGNNAPFMNKIFSNAIMNRSKLKNKFNKNPTELNKSLYNIQRNYCINLLKGNSSVKKVCFLRF